MDPTLRPLHHRHRRALNDKPVLHVLGYRVRNQVQRPKGGVFGVPGGGFEGTSTIGAHRKSMKGEHCRYFILFIHVVFNCFRRMFFRCSYGARTVSRFVRQHACAYYSDKHPGHTHKCYLQTAHLSFVRIHKHPHLDDVVCGSLIVMFSSRSCSTVHLGPTAPPIKK